MICSCQLDKSSECWARGTSFLSIRKRPRFESYFKYINFTTLYTNMAYLRTTSPISQILSGSLLDPNFPMPRLGMASLAETHWLTVWSLGHWSQDLRIRPGQDSKISKYDIFWKLDQSFHGIYQNYRETSSFKSPSVPLQSRSSLAQTHWLTVWSLGHRSQDLRLRPSPTKSLRMTWLPQFLNKWFMDDRSIV